MKNTKLKNELKRNVKKMLLQGAVLILGFIFVMYVAVPLATAQINNAMYKFGASLVIKQTKECVAFTDQYVEEMTKGQTGHPNQVVEEAKKSKCKK